MHRLEKIDNVKGLLSDTLCNSKSRSIIQENNQIARVLQTRALIVHSILMMGRVTMILLGKSQWQQAFEKSKGDQLIWEL